MLFNIIPLQNKQNKANLVLPWNIRKLKGFWHQRALTIDPQSASLWSHTTPTALRHQTPLDKSQLCHCMVGTTLCLKKTSPTFLTNLKTNYPILIIFGTNILDTTCHQMTIQFFISSSICFCTTWGKHNKRNINFLSNAI